MPSHPRQNGKQSVAAMQLIAGKFGVPLEELEAVAAKYRPTLEACGVLDELMPYQETLLLIWLWRHEKEKGKADARVEYGN